MNVEQLLAIGIAVFVIAAVLIILNMRTTVTARVNPKHHRASEEKHESHVPEGVEDVSRAKDE